jgi:hypothetical protein
MKTKLLTLFLLAGSCFVASSAVVFGVGVGVVAPPPPPPVAYATQSPYGYYPGYTWVGGYWYWGGARYAWRPGYWARPPYAHAYWVAPRYHGGRYYGGYWHRR